MRASTSREHDEPSGITRRVELMPTSRPPELGEVVRDAMDHVHVIARDTVTLGRLEAEGVITKAKEDARTAYERAKSEGRVFAAKARVEAEDVVIRVTFGAIAAAVGAIGTVFFCIAAFLGLGAFIPSLAVRFAIFAVVFLSASVLAAFQATRKRRALASRHHADPRLRHIAPLHQVGGENV
jgi:hypothetical protein